MRKENEYLLEQVLSTIMKDGADASNVAEALKSHSPDARISTVIRALLAADKSLAETFNGPAPVRSEAELARRLALTLAEHLDDHEHAKDGGLLLRDLPI